MLGMHCSATVNESEMSKGVEHFLSSIVCHAMKGVNESKMPKSVEHKMENEKRHTPTQCE